MAPKRGTKRAAEEAPVNPLQETLRKHGVAKAEFTAIEEALNHPLAPGLTEECRKMLVAMAPHAVCVRAESRTKQQQASVDMITELMQGIMEAMQAEIDCENAKLSEVDASKLTLETKEQETQAALVEASEAFALRKRALAKAAKAVLTAKAALAEREQEQRSGEKAQEKVVEDKASLDAVLAHDFRRLRDGDVEGDDDVKAMYSRLEEQASKLELEASLVTALPPCMTKKPSARGSFDAMVVAQLEEALTSKLSRLAEAVTSAVPAAEARRAAVETAVEQLAAAKGVQQAAADEMTSAGEQQKEREKEHQAATAALADFMPNHVQAVTARDGKVEQLHSFKDWNLACFETVRDRVDAPKKQKTAEVVEELPSKEVAEVEGAAPLVAEAGA